MHKTLILAAGMVIGMGSTASSVPPGSSDFEALRERAETLFAQGSYARAREVYAKTLEWELTDEQARWRDFRIQDARWRAADASDHPDDSDFREAGEALNRMVRDATRAEDQDRIWAEIQESLGDYYWMSRRQGQWSQALNAYRRALDWWAGAPDIETARTRYLGIIRRMVTPTEARRHWRPSLPLDLLDNVYRISVTPADRARAALLLAEGLIRGGTPRRQLRIPELFEEALEGGRQSGFYDDALMQYANWLTDRGRPRQDDDGRWQHVRDYPAALVLYRRLLREFSEGETRHYRAAGQRVEQITKTEIGVSVAHTFLPESEIELHLNWRNTPGIDLALRRVSLTQDVRLRARDDRNWLEALSESAGERVRQWRHDTKDRGDHEPGREVIRLEALPVGAYLLTARANGQTARELVLVTDMAVVMKTAPGYALVYVCDAFNGSPIPDAEIKIWQSYHENRRLHWESFAGRSDKQGVARLDLPDRANRQSLLVFAAGAERQAYSSGWMTGHRGRRAWEGWRLYAVSDRTAYRPGDQAQWKVIARRFDGRHAVTPSGEAIEYTLRDGRGGELAAGRLELNEFGSAWDSLTIGDETPLGMVRVEFHPPGNRRRQLGSAELFRVEEYKLPEFIVSVEVPRDDDGQPLSFLPGDEVTVDVSAQYYFGGPVLDAEVEILVREFPFRFQFPEPREFPWLYEGAGSHPVRRPGHGGGQVIAREQSNLDENGRASITFVPPERGEQDREYRIEARVVDASRREISGTGAVRVTRQRYQVRARPTHRIHRPGDRAEITFLALDPNSRPVTVEGRVRVVREFEHEIWVRPDGREIFGDALRHARSERSVWPPPDWRPRRPGREREEILATTLRTNNEGEAVLHFTPGREGHYRVLWSSPQKDGPRIQADTMVWVADRATTDLGVRTGRLQLIVDRDTFREGEEAPVMLVAPTSGRHVLFSVEAEDLLHWEIIPMEGSVRLIRLPVTEEHIPNVWLSALLVQDCELHQADEEIVVPPLRRTLEVTVSPETDAVKPAAASAWTVDVRDHEGEPVEAELSFGLSDEAIFYIQEEIAGDPRAFFFDGRRVRAVATRSSFQEKAYRRLDPKPPEPPPPAIPEHVRSEVMRRDRMEEGVMVMRGLGARRSMDMADGEVAFLAPDAAPAPMARAVMEDMPMEAEAAPEITVRTDFRATAFWQPDLRTDAQGRVELTADMPQSLTSWRGIARVATRDNAFGYAEAVVRTRLPLMARLQTPRFLVAGDEATVSVMIDNHSEETLTIRPELKLEGVQLLDASPADSAGVEVPAGGQSRVDWRIRAEGHGEALLRVAVSGGGYADAMERTLPVHEHGIERAITLAGKVDADQATLLIDLPAERRPGSSRLQVQVTPSLAVAMLDALPYLAHYPYGCTEQTMSRFLPAVIVAHTFAELGLTPEAVAGRIFGGIHAADDRTHPKGRGDLAKLDDMVRAGLDRLYDFQHVGGGWGWWKEGNSDPYMSAYVVWGLALARGTGIEVRSGVLDRGRDYLRRTLVEHEQQPDLQAWMLHALSALHAGGAPHEFETRAMENLWSGHTRLNAYTRALLALALHRFGRTDNARLLVRNLENGVKRDETPDTSIVLDEERASHPLVMATAHWGDDGIVRRWSQGSIESTAFALQALMTIAPDSALVEPVMNWLVKNRRGAQWSNTRDTAIAVLAFNAYLQQSGELARAVSYVVRVNGQKVAEERFEPGTFPEQSIIEVEDSMLRDGENRIVIERRGEGPLYVSAQALFFSLECPVPAGGYEIFARRRYYRYVGRPTLLKGVVYDRVPLREGDRIHSGDRIETVVTVEAKNHYEYLVFEDLKPAGFEAVDVQSGGPFHARELRATGAALRMDDGAWPDGEARREQVVLERADYTGRQRWVYRELRDRKVALFIDQLPEGFWEMRYMMRAETPGAFHALPVLGYAMYLPELRCNSREDRIVIHEKMAE